MKNYYFTLNYYDDEPIHIATLVAINNEEFMQKLLTVLEEHFDLDLNITNHVSLEKCNEFMINRVYIKLAEPDDQIYIPDYVFIQRTKLY